MVIGQSVFETVEIGMISNDELAILILKLDPRATWVYNKYCGYCAKFLYPEELANRRCKKCNTSTDRGPISRAIPFITSGTAFEKVLEWVKGRYVANVITHDQYLPLAGLYTDWLYSRETLDQYHQRYVDTLGAVLTSLLASQS